MIPEQRFFLLRKHLNHITTPDMMRSMEDKIEVTPDSPTVVKRLI